MALTVLYLVLQQLPSKVPLYCAPWASAELVSVLTIGAATHGVAINIEVPAQRTMLPV